MDIYMVCQGKNILKFRESGEKLLTRKILNLIASEPIGHSILFVICRYHSWPVAKQCRNEYIRYNEAYIGI